MSNFHHYYYLSFLKCQALNTITMQKDQSLKKRIVAPRSENNDTTTPAYFSGHRPNNANMTGGPRSGVPRISTTTVARHRERLKGSRSANRTYFNRLKRIARAFASHNRINMRSAISTTLKMMTFLLCLVQAFFIFFKNEGNNTNTTRNLRKNGQRGMPKFEISFSQTHSRNFSKSFFEIDAIETGLEQYQDFGGLEIWDIGRKRKISDIDYLSKSHFRNPEQGRDDDGNDAYLAFDDDYLRGTEGMLEPELLNESQLKNVCRRTSAHRLNMQNCNTIFELDLLSNELKYLK